MLTLKTVFTKNPMISYKFVIVKPLL